MPFRVLIAGRAERQLDRVADWYSERHPAGLERFVQDFEKFLTFIAAFPLAGRERPEVRESIRSWNVHPFVVFYTVDERARMVVVRSIVHGRMDLTEY